MQGLQQATFGGPLPGDWAEVYSLPSRSATRPHCHGRAFSW